jgi:hypothetical protein
MNRFFIATLLGVLLLSAGCKPKVDDRAAILAGVTKHLAGMSGLNVNNMSIVVTTATVTGDKAKADVEIRAKNGDPSAPPMQLTYDLRKQGQEWVVLKGQPTGGMDHPAAGQMPPQGGGAMPAGHPPVGGAGGQMPADHPDFNSILNSAQPSQQAQPQQGSSQQPAPQPSNTSKP